MIGKIIHGTVIAGAAIFALILILILIGLRI
jgi:hypothetical protein